MTETGPGLSALRPDPRFFDTAPPLGLVDAVGLCGAEIVRAPSRDGRVTHAAPLGRAGEGAVVFAQGERALRGIESGEPALVIADPETVDKVEATFPRAAIAASRHPRAAFARIASALHTSRLEAMTEARGIAEDADIDDDARVSPTAVVMAGAIIGAGARIGPFCLVGPGVVIGEGTELVAHCTVAHALIGRDCRLDPGARIGGAGFGYAPSPEGAIAVPQLGRVILGDYVDIGSNTTVDRGALEDTVIGDGTKADNLVQIAHNVRIGRSVLIASQVGISGSVTLEDGVMIGGQAGFADHVTIGAGATIVGRAGIMKDVPPGERWGGYPAKPTRDWLRESAILSKLSKKEKR